VTITADIAHLRLSNQLVASPSSGSPGDVVGWLGAVQAQDYLGALWAIGLRLQNAVEADVEQALADRSIVRTWPLRGTLHFVAAADVRWMLDLIGPRMIARSAGRFRELELDAATFARARELFSNALQGGRQLTRDAMYQVLESAGISTAGQRGIWILGRLAQEGLICFGAREGKQHTFVLLEEWVPQAKTMERDQALAELARRYFTSHGPAALPDFVWWSGLATSEARAALEIARPYLLQEVITGETYWFPSSIPAASDGSPTAYLLPAFDEYLVGYKDRRAVLDPRYVKLTNAGGGMLNPTIVIDGQVRGAWKRTLKKGAVVITPGWFAKLNKADMSAFNMSALRYGEFLGLPVLLIQV